MSDTPTPETNAAQREHENEPRGGLGMANWGDVRRAYAFARKLERERDAVRKELADMTENANRAGLSADVATGERLRLQDELSALRRDNAAKEKALRAHREAGNHRFHCMQQHTPSGCPECSRLNKQAVELEVIALSPTASDSYVPRAEMEKALKNAEFWRAGQQVALEASASNLAERDSALKERAALNGRVTQLEAERDFALKERDNLRPLLDEALKERDEARAHYGTTAAVLNKTVADRDRLALELARSETQTRAEREACDLVKCERDRLAAELADAKTLLFQTQAKRIQLEGDLEKLAGELETLKASGLMLPYAKIELEAVCARKDGELIELRAELAAAQKERDEAMKWRAFVGGLEAERNLLQSACDATQANVLALREALENMDSLLGTCHAVLMQIVNWDERWSGAAKHQAGTTANLVRQKMIHLTESLSSPNPGAPLLAELTKLKQENSYLRLERTNGIDLKDGAPVILDYEQIERDLAELTALREDKDLFDGLIKLCRDFWLVDNIHEVVRAAIRKAQEAKP